MPGCDLLSDVFYATPIFIFILLFSKPACFALKKGDFTPIVRAAPFKKVLSTELHFPPPLSVQFHADLRAAPPQRVSPQIGAELL